VRRFLFFGGKGGVGKTTCAAARAVREAAGGSRVLVVSADPAHSLGDALDVRLSAAPRRVRIRAARGPGFLDAVELDAVRAFARWLDRHRRPLADVIEQGTWLDGDDADSLLELSVPGVDELVGLIEIMRLAGGSRRSHEILRRRPKSKAGTAGNPYDLIVVDTAPTGHTLRLLNAPETVKAVARVLDTLQDEQRIVRERFARVASRLPGDRVIRSIADQAADAEALLRDTRRTTFHWVTAAEALSVAESEDAIRQLEQAGLSVQEVIVNRLTPDGGPCALCDSRRRAERRTLAGIRRRFGHRRVLRLVPAALREPRGVQALLQVSRHLTGRPRTVLRRTSGPDLVGRPWRGAEAGGAEDPGEGAPQERHTAPESIAALRDTRLIFFTGKGGVGKTTVAAATAIRLARSTPGRHVLLLSTDPAHSLADVLDAPVGDRSVRIPGAPSNLEVRELDAAAALEARRAGLRAALEQIASALGAGASVHVAGGAAARELIDLAPPGVDELLGILLVADLLESRYHKIVVDTAPTGHALRLFEMPGIVREWIQVLMRVLLKYRSVVRPGPLAAELVNLSKSIRALQTLLRDEHDTAFVVVTRAAELPRRETERLLVRLRASSLHVPALLINALTLAPGACARCRSTAAPERAAVAALRRRLRRPFRECAIIQASLVSPPPRGVAALASWAGSWTSIAGKRTRKRRIARP
jgi:arsenite-transporting ATPase